MPFPRKKRTSRDHPERNNHQGQRLKYGWLKWLFPITGFLALVWFLIRVIPKPSRATYPCQRAAFPIASGFVVWITGLLVSAAAFRKARLLLKRSQVVLACLCAMAATVTGVVSLVNVPQGKAVAEVYITEVHDSIGQAKGIYPGRVVWVHDPNATDWEGPESEEHWFDSNHTDLAVVEEMLSQSVRGVAGKGTVSAAWDAIFRNFNISQGKGDVGYAAGEKIAMKINLTTCNATTPLVDPVTYDKDPTYINNIDNSPQMILALLRQLVYEAGVDQSDITFGDPTGMIPNYMWNIIHPEFPDVNYMDNEGGMGRTRVEFSEVPLYWSTPDAVGKPGKPLEQDYIPSCFAEADYMINFAILKGHSAGITVCAKNHYGSLIRTPVGNLWKVDLDYYDLHDSLPNAGWSPGTGHYRALVDLMGHPELGGKTVLYLLDGLFAGYYWDSEPYKWDMEPFNGDWPSSIFASMDGVAIDSVAYDFLLEEWPDVVTGGTGAPGSLEGGAEDYLHEAAMANDPCSGSFYDPAHDGNVVQLESLGVHEHWNNSTDKQYSRNLGEEYGIELIALSQRITGDIATDGKVNFIDFGILAGQWMSSGCGECEGADLTDDGNVGPADLSRLSENWLAGL
ncbi:MAG: DUF362 domain-containing protein [Planctomycetota bacterium]|nr:MAG: DUF362 domain-containing protein [Planctomycetota bacterium]